MVLSVSIIQKKRSAINAKGIFKLTSAKRTDNALVED